MWVRIRGRVHVCPSCPRRSNTSLCRPVSKPRGPIIMAVGFCQRRLPASVKAADVRMGQYLFIAKLPTPLQLQEKTACRTTAVVERQGPTFPLPSRPTSASSVSPRASTRMDSAHFAASTRLIFPLYLGGACPIRLAWYINPYLGVCSSSVAVQSGKDSAGASASHIHRTPQGTP